VAKAQDVDDEIQEAHKEFAAGGGMTTAEVLAHLQSVIDSHGSD
jgi:hypothetical protein